MNTDKRRTGLKTWRPPTPAPGVVLSVRFTAEEFARVNRAAEAAGERTSAFVREAALDRARR